MPEVYTNEYQRIVLQGRSTLMEPLLSLDNNEGLYS